MTCPAFGPAPIARASLCRPRVWSPGAASRHRVTINVGRRENKQNKQTHTRTRTRERTRACVCA